MRENAAYFRSLGEGLGVPLDVYYALKACYFPAVLRIFSESGLGADCQSVMEMEIARGAGFKHDRIVYNSPAKSPASVLGALRKGSRVILDSESECRAYLPAATAVARFGLRVNCTTGSGGEFIGVSDRFGVSLAAASGLLPLFPGPRSAGMLHCHCLTHSSSPAAARRTFRSLMEWYRKAGAGMVLNLGGGFESRLLLKLKGIDVADILAAQIGLLGAARNETRFAVEPGRALVGDAAVAVSSVVAVKRGADGRPWAMLDIGTNLLIPTRSAKFWVLPLQGGGHSALTRVNIGDGTCSPAGVIHLNARLPRLKPGDRVAVLGTGGYTYSLCETFHSQVPPCYLMKHGGGLTPLVSPSVSRGILKMLYLRGHTSA